MFLNKVKKNVDMSRARHTGSPLQTKNPEKNLGALVLLREFRKKWVVIVTTLQRLSISFQL